MKYSLTFSFFLLVLFTTASCDTFPACTVQNFSTHPVTLNKWYVMPTQENAVLYETITLHPEEACYFLQGLVPGYITIRYDNSELLLPLKFPHYSNYIILNNTGVFIYDLPGRTYKRPFKNMNKKENYDSIFFPIEKNNEAR